MKEDEMGRMCSMTGGNARRKESTKKSKAWVGK
jgi:hypothetical protein